MLSFGLPSVFYFPKPGAKGSGVVYDIKSKICQFSCNYSKKDFMTAALKRFWPNYRLN